MVMKICLSSACKNVKKAGGRRPPLANKEVNMINRINKIIEEEVKPQLALHDGDIEVLKVEDGIVEIKFLGACKGCPSAKLTIEDVVEKALKKNIPEIKSVIQVYDVSSELWDAYKDIIKNDR